MFWGSFQQWLFGSAAHAERQEHGRQNTLKHFLVAPLGNASALDADTNKMPVPSPRIGGVGTGIFVL